MSKILVFSADRTLENGLPQNIGDALLTDSLCSAIEEAGHTVQAVDFSPFVRVHRMRERARAGNLFQLWKLLLAADAVLVGGGTLLADDQPESRVAGLPRFCFVLSALSWLARRPLAYFAVGCDPINRRFAKLLLCLATFRRPVAARDAKSVERCRRLRPAKVTLAADAALLQNHFRGPPDSDLNREGAIVALNKKHVPDLNSRVIDDLKSTFGKVSFLAMDQSAAGDSRGLHHDLTNTFDDLLVDQTWQQAVDHVRSAQVVVASRMHALYIALMTGTPAIAIGDDAKIISFADEFHVERISNFERFSFSSLDSTEFQQLPRRAASRRVELALKHFIEDWN